MDLTDTSPIAVCYDCLCLIGFFRTVKSLFHDEDETLNCTGHSEADGYALVRHIPQIYTAVFVLAAGCEWDDAICSKDRDAA